MMIEAAEGRLRYHHSSVRGSLEEGAKAWFPVNILLRCLQFREQYMLHVRSECKALWKVTLQGVFKVQVSVGHGG